MEYSHIKNYLDKVKGILFSKEETNSVIVSVIEKNISFKLDTKSLTIRGADIYIKTTPIIKNEVLIQKGQILKDLSFMLPKNNFKDIK